MKIESTKTYSINNGKKIIKNRPLNGGFFIKPENDIDLPENSEKINSIGSLSSLDALLSIQEINDVTSSNKRAVFKGKRILNLLDDLKLGLLSGRIPEAKLESLLSIVKSRNNEVADPRIASILDEIELRASVELAKLGK